MLGDYASAPDVVAYPRNEADVAAVIDWAGAAQAALTPFGGGSSGVRRRRASRDRRPRYKAAVTLDLRHLGRVLEVDATSRAALIEGGAYGPALEAQLKPHGLTLRHFPQSFECSTLGGWIATRSGGHFATLYTHIDDFVESAARRHAEGRGRDAAAARLGRGAEPRPLFIGSEGILGVITQAWMRLQRSAELPRRRAVRFPDFFAAARAVRAIAQAGLYPANCRILDPQEAFNTGAADGSVAIMVLGLRIRRPPARRLDGARAANAAPTTAARRNGRDAGDAHREGAPAPGATPSSACPMRASA